MLSPPSERLSTNGPTMIPSTKRQRSTTAATRVIALIHRLSEEEFSLARERMKKTRNAARSARKRKAQMYR